MSSLRSILLHLDPSSRSSKRHAIARGLALQHGAQVTALYASTPSALSVSFALAEGMAEVLPMLQQLDIDYRDQAKARFDRAASGDRPAMDWRELGNEPLIPGFSVRALCADLMILGQHDASDPLTLGVPSDFAASVLLASGRPALIVPYVDTGDTLGKQVLIAWKSTSESAHAVSAAIPFLQRADGIHLTMDTEGHPLGHSADGVIEYLRRHDVQAPIQQHAPIRAQASAGEALLSLAADVGADLLVMGCYGHSRARELVLGGATRTVLQSMTLPVLLAH